MIAASGLGWLIGPVVAGGVADVAGWRIASLVLAVVRAPAHPADRALCRAAPHGREAREGALRGGARARPPQSRDRGRGARQRPPRHRRRGLGAAAARSHSRATVSRPAASGSPSASRLPSGSPLQRSSAGCVPRRCISAASGSPSRSSPAPGCSPPLGSRRFALLAFLLVSTGCRSAINALNFAVGVRASSGDSAPAVIGVMNLAWAVMALSTPLLAGLADGSAGVRAAFALTGLAAAAVAVVSARTDGGRVVAASRLTSSSSSANRCCLSRSVVATLPIRSGR